MLVVFNDTQLVRNCDLEAFGAFIKFLERYKDDITHIVANGDILDMEQANRFGYTEDMAQTMADEIAAGKWLFSYLSYLLPNAEKVLVQGNHEARWNNLIANQTNGIAAWIKTYEEQFHFSELRWRSIPYGRGNYYKWHDRIFYHGSRAAGKGNNAKSELDDAKYSTTTGHTNRNEYWQQRTVLGETLSSYAHGGFSKDNLGYIKKANTGWNQGFGVYYWHPEVGEQVYSVELHHGNPSYIFGGEIFSGKGWKLPLNL